jgi:hypothetical protein
LVDLFGSLLRQSKSKHLPFFSRSMKKTGGWPLTNHWKGTAFPKIGQPAHLWGGAPGQPTAGAAAPGRGAPHGRSDRARGMASTWIRVGTAGSGSMQACGGVGAPPEEGRGDGPNSIEDTIRSP